MAEDIRIGEARIHVLDSADCAQSAEQTALLEALEHLCDGDPEQLIAHLRTREALLALSRVRGNLLAWYELAPGSRVLEICDFDGMASECLLWQDVHVTAVFPSRTAALICGHVHRKASRLEIWAGEATDTLIQLNGPFDCIIIQGAGIESGPLFEKCRNLLAKEGRLLVSADNYMGYRRLATPAVSEIGSFDIFGRAPARPLLTHTRLTKLLEDIGLHVLNTWYPHPDRIFARCLFSDDRPPAAGELAHHADPSATSTIRTLNEDSLLRDFAAESAYGKIADSFLVEAGAQEAESSPVHFAKLSNERRRELAIATTIDRARIVRKRALYPEGRAHVQGLLDLHDQLAQQHAGRFAPNCISADGTGAIIAEFITGQTLEDILVGLITSGQKAEAEALLAEYRWRIESTAATPFKLTDEFLEVFGRQASPEQFAALEGLPCQSVTDVDLILRNIIIVDDVWHVLDFEWTFDFPIPCAFVLWRALFYLLASKGVQAREGEYGFYPAWGFGDAEREIFFKMEVSMQQFITGDAESIDTILEESSSQPLLLDELVARAQAADEAVPGASRRHGLLSFLRRS